MRIACLNQDRGISPARKKGAAVHLAAMRAAFRSLGAEVVGIDEPDDERARQALEEGHGRSPFALLYERYALGRATGARFARRHAVPFVLEMNAPLAEEARLYREAADEEEVRATDALVLGSAERIVAVSEPVADYALARGASPAAVEVHPNGVDLARFRPRASGDARRAELVPAGRFALGFHGRLRPWHGIDLLVDAFVALLGREVPVHLVFVGVGDMRAVLGTRVPAGRSSLVEWVPHEDVGSYVAAFDVLPLTYGEDAPCYYSPLKLAEAMACGVVPVFPPLGDLGRVLRDGENAVSYRAGDPTSLADAVQRLAEDEPRRRALAAGALGTARELGWERIAASVLECARAREGRRG